MLTNSIIANCDKCYKGKAEVPGEGSRYDVKGVQSLSEEVTFRWSLEGKQQ